MYTLQTPERKLLAAILLQAVKDARGAMNLRPSKQAAAKRWLRRGEADWICHILGLDPRRVREHTF